MRSAIAHRVASMSQQVDDFDRFLNSFDLKKNCTMKSKLLFAFLLMALPMLALLTSMQASAKTDATPPPANAVGYLQNGQAFPLLDRLRTTFKNGGTITHFEFVQRPDGLHLVRRGIQNGNPRVEFFRVVVDAPFIKYQPALVSICAASDCGGCNWANDKFSCYCNSDMDRGCPVSTDGFYALDLIVLN
jgi:hypothetical protein